MRPNSNSQAGLVDPSATSESSGSRTSIRTMALVVLALVAVAFFSRFGSNPLSKSTAESITEEQDLKRDPSVGSQHNIQPIDCAFLSALEDTIHDSKQNILTYWNVSNYPNFLSMMSIPTQSWKIQKAKYVKLLLEANTQHLVKQQHNGNSSADLTFIAGFSGSSVTAGHDNYFHEAFPQVFFDALQPVFQTMGVNFTVRNHALGNNPCYPYDACIATHLGQDLDLLAWEQSMNCGRYPAPVDTFSRAAHSMPKKPTLLYLTSGGPVWTRKECLEKNITTSGSRGPLTATEKSLLTHTTSENALLNPAFTQNNFLKDDNQNLFVDRFASLAPMAQSVFGAEEYKCLGPYNASFCEKTPGGGATHHPGKLMHKLRGENLAFFQLEMLLDAVRDVKKLACTPNTLETGSSSKDTSTDTTTVMHALLSVQLNLTYPTTQSLLPASTVHHTPTTLSAHIYTFVTEYLYYLQTPPLPSVPSKYNLPETSVPPTCYTSFEPRVSNPLEDIIPPEHSNWHSELSFLDKNAVEKSIALGRGYIDRKYIFSSTGVNSTLTLNVHVKGVNGDNSSSKDDKSTPIWLCEVQKGFAKYPVSHADLPIGADVFIEYNVKPSAVTAARPSPGLRSNNSTVDAPAARDWSRMAKLELTQLKNECYRTPPVVPGDHRLTIVQNSEKFINIAYVISW